VEPTLFLNSEEIADLTMALRTAGFSVGIPQCIAAERLMVTLAAQGKMFSDRGEFRTWLAPIFCASPREQADFSNFYGEWLVRTNEADATGETPQSASSKEGAAKFESQVSPLRRFLAGWLLTLALAGVLFGGYQIRGELMVRTLLVSVVDQQNAPVTKPSLTFRGKAVQPDHDNQFTIRFRLLYLPGKIEAQSAGFDDAVELDSSNYQQQQVTLHVGPRPVAVEGNKQPGPTNRHLLTAAEVLYLKQAIAVARSPVSSREVPAESTWQRIYQLHYRDLFIAACSLPLLILAIWLLWAHLPRLQLIRWKSQSDIRLNTLRVSGSGSEFFNSPGFRRITQQLRRHRLTESTDLDAERTVVQSANRGGWFTPVYQWRQRLPDYLVLVDRAGFRDLQGKLIDDFVRSLRQGRVEIDCYDFHTDPRICYLRTDTAPSTAGKRKTKVELSDGNRSHSPTALLTAMGTETANSRRFVLDDLLAKHPNHILLIFSDTAGFFSSVTGKLQPWVERFSQWTFRALFVPETMVGNHLERRAEILNDAGFLTLPATEKGLSKAVDILDSGQMTQVIRAWRTDSANPFPSLLVGDDLRWMSDLPPRPAHVKLLLQQLRLYLGEETFAWLCACAVYPELSWDLTLYLGNALRVLGSDEKRLSSLLRLPWFRYGTMPDWLRRTLADAMSTEERKRVRQALWRLLETALDVPLQHFELRYATEEKEKTFYRKLKTLPQRGILRNFLRTEPPASALRDYVFVSILHGREAGVGLRLPDKLTQLWGRVGHPSRPIIQTAAAMLASAAIGVTMYLHPPKPIAAPDEVPQALPAPTGPPPYHLALDQVIGSSAVRLIEDSPALVFQVTGNTGSPNHPLPQQQVADAMTEMFTRQAALASASPQQRPSFLYLLGNIVSPNGAASNYYDQFYRPYKNYPAPIFAIPGNHDGVPAAAEPSLYFFVRNFGARSSVHTPEAGATSRASLTEPNSYWTLDAPFVTIIGLYTNTTTEGYISKAQESWLTSELERAPADKALIIALHNSIYSRRYVQSGSAYLSGVLDRVMLSSRRAPDLILSAGDNNYQRFSRKLGDNGRILPYINVGTGGYPSLSKLPANTTTPSFLGESSWILNFFDDNDYGFLRLTVSQTAIQAEYMVARQSKGAPVNDQVDSFTEELVKPAAPVKPVPTPRANTPSTIKWPSFTGSSRLLGKTLNFTLYTDTSLGSRNDAMAPAILKNLEVDYNALSSYYGLRVPPFNIVMFALGGQTDGTGGADLAACDATNIEVDVSLDSPERVSALVAVEQAHVFQTLHNKVVNCGYSNGEGLFRALGESLHPGALSDFATAPQWAQDGMPDFINKTDQTDQNADSTGAAVLFYNWLHYQLGYSWEQIVRAGAPTLAETYRKLTNGKTSAFEDLMAAIQALPNGVTNDNPFVAKAKK
jgi:acid phosphatase type 7